MCIGGVKIPAAPPPVEVPRSPDAGQELANNQRLVNGNQGLASTILAPLGSQVAAPTAAPKTLLGQ